MTIREIAAELDVPESNLRYYRDYISEFLPSKGRGRKRRYSSEALEIFRDVLEMVKEGIALDKIRIRLANEKPIAYPKPEPQRPQAESATPIIEELASKLGEILAAVATERKNATLETQVKTLTGEASALKQKRDGFIRENEEKNKTLMELRVERDHLMKKLRESDAEKLALKETINRLKEEIAVKERGYTEALSQELRSIKSLLENLFFKAKGGDAAHEQEKMPN
ncbi:MAG: MerR family transcriptional regulator [bacterium]